MVWEMQAQALSEMEQKDRAKVEEKMLKSKKVRVKELMSIGLPSTDMKKDGVKLQQIIMKADDSKSQSTAKKISLWWK